MKESSFISHTWSTLNFVPSIELLDHFRNAYEKMRVMIYGDYPDFDEIIRRLKFFNGRFRLMGTGFTLEEVIEKAVSETGLNINVKIKRLPVMMNGADGKEWKFVVTLHSMKSGDVFEKLEIGQENVQQNQDNSPS